MKEEYVKQRDMSTEKGHKEPLYEGRRKKERTLAFFFLRVVVLALVLFPRSLNSVKRSEEMSLTAKRRGGPSYTHYYSHCETTLCCFHDCSLYTLVVVIIYGLNHKKREEKYFTRILYTSARKRVGKKYEWNDRSRRAL